MILHDLLKVPRFPYKNILHNKGHLNLGKEVLKAFSPRVFNRLCVTHSKSGINGNLEPKIELIVSFFFKVALKTTVVNSGS